MVSWNLVNIDLGNLGCFGTDLRRMIPGLHAANERRRYKVTPSLIDWAQT